MVVAQAQDGAEEHLVDHPMADQGDGLPGVAADGLLQGRHRAHPDDVQTLPAGEADGVGSFQPGPPEVGVAGLDLRNGQPLPLPKTEVYQAVQRLGLEPLGVGDDAGGLHRPGEGAGVDGGEGPAGGDVAGRRPGLFQADFVQRDVALPADAFALLVPGSLTVTDEDDGYRSHVAGLTSQVLCPRSQDGKFVIHNPCGVTCRARFRALFTVRGGSRPRGRSARGTPAR